MSEVWRLLPRRLYAGSAAAGRLHHLSGVSVIGARRPAAPPPPPPPCRGRRPAVGSLGSRSVSRVRPRGIPAVALPCACGARASVIVPSLCVGWFYLLWACARFSPGWLRRTHSPPGHLSAGHGLFSCDALQRFPCSHADVDLVLFYLMQLRVFCYSALIFIVLHISL